MNCDNYSKTVESAITSLFSQWKWEDIFDERNLFWSKRYSEEEPYKSIRIELDAESSPNKWLSCVRENLKFVLQWKNNHNGIKIKEFLPTCIAFSVRRTVNVKMDPKI